jgi:hypothetical protein
MSVLDHTTEVERYAENADQRVLQKTLSSAHFHSSGFAAVTSPGRSIDLGKFK